MKICLRAFTGINMMMSGIIEVPNEIGYLYRMAWTTPEQPPQNLTDASIEPTAREIHFEWKGDYVAYHGERVRVYVLVAF